MKKILFVSGSLNRGGAQRVITLLANEYAREGWNVHVAVLLVDDIGYELEAGIRVHSLVHKGNYFKMVPCWIAEMKRLIKEIKPNVIVSFAGRINMISMLAARGTGIPVLVSERNDPARDRRSRIEKWLTKLFYSRAEKVVLQTAYQKKYYEKWCKKNSVVIGNPISAPVYEGEHSKKDIICVGKLMAQKNHPMMIEAFSQIKDEFPDKQVFIYGEGAERQKLHAMIDEKGLTNRIHLCGNTDKMFDIMHEYQYFVMCSDYEGLSNALLEAMISGMTCITTAWSGVEEIVVDGENGYLVPVGDTEALAEKMKYVLKKQNAEVVRRGIEIGLKFSGDEIMGQWKKTIEQMVRK